MPLARFSIDGSSPRLGKVFDEVLIDLSMAAPALPADIKGFLAAGEKALEVFPSVALDGPGRV